MKVTLASMVFPHPERGVWPGIERHAGELARALVEEGARVTVLTTFWNGGPERETWNGIEIRRVPDARQRWGRAGFLASWNIRSFGRSILRHRDLLASSDAVHAFVALSSHREIARMGVPLFASFPHRERPSGLVETLVHAGRLALERDFFRGTRAVFAGSEDARQVLLDEYGLEPDRVHVIPLGVDETVFRPPDSPRPADPEAEREEGLRLLYVGPLIRRKGLRTLIEALPAVSRAGVKFSLDMVGKGPEEESLRALARRLGVEDRIRRHGYLAEKDLVRLYQGSDLFVFPSLQEGFGLVMVEAMACGLPVIATDVPPMPQVVGEGGVTVTPSDPGALAATIIELARDHDRRGRLSAAGLARVRAGYLWRRVARQTLEHYEAARRPAREGP